MNYSKINNQLVCNKIKQIFCKKISRDTWIIYMKIQQNFYKENVKNNNLKIFD